MRFDPQTSQIELYPLDEKSQVFSLWFSPKTVRPNGLIPVVTFISCATKTLRIATLCNDKFETKFEMDLNPKFGGAAVFLFTFQNYLYVLGEQSCVWYNFKTVQALPSLNAEWHSVAWIVANEHLYRFGEYHAHNTVRRFSLLSQQWTDLPSLETSRTHSSAAWHPESKRILVSGGYCTICLNQDQLPSHEHEFPDTIEIFDTKTQCFIPTEEKLTMPKSLWNHFSFFFNGFYFLVGGYCKSQTNFQIWKHQFTDDGKFVGKWQEVTTISFHITSKEMLFG